ncbi:hypothetical protein RND81_06G235500 [Saponaria officinalis]|uniref:Uncharacterized protein n=1 Tax=Saponaria officinalis TaxID=3572 RepID=A0AAW1KFT5_SAPOF
MSSSSSSASEAEVDGDSSDHVGSGEVHIDRLVATYRQPTPSPQIKDDLYAIWDKFVTDCGDFFYMDADLFFIPIVVGEHFFIACVNFKDKAIDILDNQKMIACEEESTVHVYAEAAVFEGLSDFYEKWSLEKCSGCSKFELRFLKLKWQDDAPNDNESALFTMMHMLMYEGTAIDDPNMVSKKYRRILVCQLSAALLLADCNLNRDVLLENVSKFVENKSDIMKFLKVQRQVQRKKQKLQK